MLRPGGELRFYEHVRSRDSLLGQFQDTAGRASWASPGLAARPRYPFGHQGLAGTPAHGLGMVGSPIGSGFSTTVPFGFG